MLSGLMSSTTKQIFLSARLPGFSGRGDKYLGDIAQDLRRVLWKTQLTFAHPTCRLPDVAWSEVALLLVEWAEDIHNDLGLWRTVEAHHCRCFGIPLPFVDAVSAGELQGFDPRRIQFLLWTLWPCLNPNQVLSPTHQDLKRLAEAAGRFLTDRLARVPQDSGFKHFLSTPNPYGWDIKRKLLWAGINSYLFRFLFFKYLDDDQREPDIGTKDDFICQHCTEWAGLGVIDVLAGALDLPEGDRAILQTWYERHQSFYRILTQEKVGGMVTTLTARNMVNGQSYTIRVDETDCPFVTGMVVFGALTPWRGEWYWSGEQKTFKNMSNEEEAKVRKEMLEKTSSIAYRYCPDEAEKARKLTQGIHERFVAHHGGDLVVFPDGLALAAAEQKRMAAEWATVDPEVVERSIMEHGLTHPRPRMNLPPEFLNHDQGIGVFANPEEGVEYKLDFHHLLSGLRKHGSDLNERELHSLRQFMTTTVVSPAFVRRMTKEHGAESIAESFLLRNGPSEWALEFLLRRHKGPFFRKRYPSLALWQPGGGFS